MSASLLRRGVSVSNNIAEGFERGTTPELLTFLYIARGSAGEVRSMLCLIEGIPEFADAQLSGTALSRALTRTGSRLTLVSASQVHCVL
ncbi:MAG TPA: four helix bundle protein [Terriglobia bacterium]|nr:four helix bundle protein [Terriglobia bacterium]